MSSKKASSAGNQQERANLWIKYYRRKALMIPGILLGMILYGIFLDSTVKQYIESGLIRAIIQLGFWLICAEVVAYLLGKLKFFFKKSRN